MKERYEHELPSWARKLGLWRTSKNCLEFNWGWISTRPAFELRLGFGYEDARPEISFGFIWPKISINIPFVKPRGFDFEQFEKSYGFYTFDNSMVFCWGRKSYFFHLPYLSYEFIDHHVLSPDGWIDPDGYMPEPEDNRFVFEYDYRYALKSGEVQTRTATVSKGRRRWHRKWFPFLKREISAIDVHFDGEVGERSNSWKGDFYPRYEYECLPKETMFDTLRRMEKEREFN